MSEQSRKAAFHDALRVAYKMRYAVAFGGAGYHMDDIHKAIFDAGCKYEADHTAAIREAAMAVFNQYNQVCDQHRIMTLTRGISNQTIHGCALCDELNSLYDELTALKAALEEK